MKQFYSIEPKHDFKDSSMKFEQVEYDINTLITEEAELCVDVETDCSDDEWEKAVTQKAQEIKKELINKGIWKNKFGTPVFLYC